MFDELSIYNYNGHFFFKETDSLSKFCNAPPDKSGVYILYVTETHELIYIGSTGKMQQNGSLKVRHGGMKDRLVNGKQFEQPRRISWPFQMRKDNINQIKVKCYVTYDDNYKHIPASIEGKLIQEYYDAIGKLPIWNIEF